MVIRKKVGLEKQWILNDGSVPFQIRIMSSEEIQSIEHLHKTMHEYFYILEGNMEIDIDGDRVRLTKDDLIVVEPGERHHVTVKSSDLLLMLIMPPPVSGDKVVIQSLNIHDKHSR